ncbi:GNAT family N-acetyltransferase [Aeromonas cavernicola]|uniref:GNAT family N-acetyltransferase n=1 Tax=Aeromonas cavernicola TaxID=1006623 RepID=A0A2H9U6F3_9GAMM|nr:GNAT family N-acetyltransferase [Aeromonas cavernicola]PJG59636.1 GNAT family N-acetyltransferase [Aeromonas cavernicola]
MKIRQATAQDIDAILALNQQIGQLHYAQYPDVFCPPSPEERAFMLQVIGSEDRLFCVAQLGNRVVGFLTARIDINRTVPFLSKQPICWVSSVVVDEHHRSQGIGRALIAHSERWAHERDAKQVRLEVMILNERAALLYESLGFTRLSQTLTKQLS